MFMTRLQAAIVSTVPLLFAVDWATKRLIETHVNFWDAYPVIPGFFSIVHAQNRGAAFSLLNDAPDHIRALVLVGFSGLVTLLVAGMLVLSFRPNDTQSDWVRLALALVLSGALGNMWDRVLRGYVTDFLLVYVGDYQWPVFNVADSAICVGAGLLLIDIWRQRGEERVS
jgi:signal peptidase II